VVARPFADRTQELVQGWAAEPGNVLLLAGPGAAVGVFLYPSVEAAETFVGSEEWKTLVSTSTTITANLEAPSVPVYFDFEGLWAHLSGISGTVAYPRGLGGSPPGPEPEAARFTRHQLWAASELVQRPFASSTGGRGGQLVGPLGLPFSERR